MLARMGRKENTPPLQVDCTGTSALEINLDVLQKEKKNGVIKWSHLECAPFPLRIHAVVDEQAVLWDAEQ